jgi:hypothetical protein
LIGNRQYNLHQEDIFYDGAPYIAPDALVTFDPGYSGSIVSGDPTQTVAYGDPATAPTVVAADGFEFLGWDRPFDRVVRDFTVRAVYLDLTPAPASFAAWQAVAGFTEAELTDPAVAGLMADPNSTGWTNVWRWAFGVQRDTPVTAFAPSTRLVREGANVYFEFSYLRSTQAPEANLLPQTSTNLTDWNHTEPAWSQHSTEPEPGLDSVERVTWRLSRDPGPAFYVRLALSFE